MRKGNGAGVAEGGADKVETKKQKDKDDEALQAVRGGSFGGDFLERNIRLPCFCRPMIAMADFYDVAESGSPCEPSSADVGTISCDVCIAFHSPLA